MTDISKTRKYINEKTAKIKGAVALANIFAGR